MIESFLYITGVFILTRLLYALHLKRKGKYKSFLQLFYDKIEGEYYLHNTYKVYIVLWAIFSLSLLIVLIDKIFLVSAWTMNTTIYSGLVFLILIFFLTLKYFLKKEKLKDISNEKRKIFGIIGTPKRLGIIEIAENDFIINWYAANRILKELGNGWRLPTKEELNVIYLNKDKINESSKRYYWTSDEEGEAGMFAWGLDFGNDGYQDIYPKSTKLSVRAVRTI